MWEGLAPATESLNAAHAAAVDMYQAEMAMVELDGDFDQLSQLSDVVDNLTTLHVTVANEGMSPALVAFVDRDQLLSTTIAGFPSCEQLGGQVLAKDDSATTVALEGMIDTIKEKSAAFFTKIAETAKKIGTGAVDFVKGTIGKITGRFKKASETPGEVNPNAEVTNGISATTMALAVAAIAGIGVAIMKIMKLPLNAEGLKALRSKIGGIITGETKGVVDASGKLARQSNVAKAMAKGAADKKKLGVLGWTKAKIKQLWSAIKRAGESLWNAVSSFGKWLASIPSKLGQWYRDQKWIVSTAAPEVKAAWKTSPLAAIKGMASVVWAIVSGPFRALGAFLMRGINKVMAAPGWVMGKIDKAAVAAATTAGKAAHISRKAGVA